MSEQVSLDFLISLKQANSNVEQTRKVGGIMDYFATMAKRANDALFRDSKGRDVADEHSKQSDKLSKSEIAKKAVKAAAFRSYQFLTNTSIDLMKKSIAIWAEHAGAMTSFRRELGLSSAEVHQFSMGVTRSAALYGTSMKSVRDFTFFMTQGAKMGQKEIEKLSGSLALLSEYGGLSTGSLMDLQNTLVQMGNKTEGEAARFALVLKAVSEQGTVPAQGLVNAWNQMGEVIPMVTSNRPEMERMFTAMAVGAAQSRYDATELSSYYQGITNKSSKLNAIFHSTRNDFAKTNEIIYEQLAEHYKNMDEQDANSVRKVMLRAEDLGFASMKQLKAWMTGYERAKKAQSATDEMFAKSAEELEARLKRDLTVMEQLHEKVNKVKAAAGNFWENWLGGEGGKALMAFLDQVVDKLGLIAEITGKRDKGKKTEADLRAEVVRNNLAVASGALRSQRSWDIETLGGTREEREKFDFYQRKMANDVAAWRSGATNIGGRGETFTPPEWALTKNDIPMLQERLGREGADTKRLEYLMGKLIGVTQEGNEERKKQTPRAGATASPPSVSGAAREKQGAY